MSAWQCSVVAQKAFVGSSILKSAKVMFLHGLLGVE